MDGFLGEIRAFAFTFVPRGWMQCNGSLLAVSQYSALFAVIGIQFGGNGQSNFALPSLGGVALLGQGEGPGLSNYATGDLVGSETVKLILPEIPMHNHSLNGKFVTGPGSSSAIKNVPTNATYLSRLLTSAGTNQAGYVKAPLTLPTPMAPGVIGNTGGSNAHENRQPLLALMVCMCVSGQFPSRN